MTLFSPPTKILYVNYSCSLKCLSLATATLLLNSHNIHADIRGNLDNANTAFRALDDNPENWKEVAQSFINVFDEFSNGIFTVLDEHGGKPLHNTFISTSLWKIGRVCPGHSFPADNYLKQETLDNMSACGSTFWHQACWGTEDPWTCWRLNPITCLICTPLTCGLMPLMQGMWLCILAGDGDPKGDPIYYFKDNVEEPLKAHICQELGVTSIKQAGLLWERDFVTPVSRLLMDHAQDMQQDAVTLQLMLNLYRCYHRCDFIAARGIDNSYDKVFVDFSAQLVNFAEVYQRFYNSLVDTILNCKAPGEMENILCGLLQKPMGEIKIGTKYYNGSWEYGLVIEHLFALIQQKLETSQASEAINNAIQIAEGLAQQLRQENNNAGVAYRMGYSVRGIHGY